MTCDPTITYIIIGAASVASFIVGILSTVLLGAFAGGPG